MILTSCAVIVLIGVPILIVIGLPTLVGLVLLDLIFQIGGFLPGSAGRRDEGLVPCRLCGRRLAPSSRVCPRCEVRLLPRFPDEG